LGLISEYFAGPGPSLFSNALSFSLTKRSFLLSLEAYIMKFVFGQDGPPSFFVIENFFLDFYCGLDNILELQTLFPKLLQYF